jgi:hypothetical protein
VTLLQLRLARRTSAALNLLAAASILDLRDPAGALAATYKETFNERSRPGRDVVHQ